MIFLYWEWCLLSTAATKCNGYAMNNKLTNWGCGIVPGIGPGGGNHPAPSYLAHNAHLHERPQRRLIVDVYVSLLTTYPYDYTSTMVLLLGVKSACKPVRSILRDLAAVSTSLYLPSLHLWLHFFFFFFFDSTSSLQNIRCCFVETIDSPFDSRVFRPISSISNQTINYSLTINVLLRSNEYFTGLCSYERGPTFTKSILFTGLKKVFFIRNQICYRRNNVRENVKL